MKIVLMFPLALAVPYVLGMTGTPLASEREGAATVLSVCDALKNIERLNGQTVTIRALIAWIDEHHGVSALAQEGLDPYVQRCPGIQRRKRSWPPALHVTSPDALDPDHGTVTFQEKAPGLSDLVTTIREYKRATGRGVLVATITGEIRTRKNVRIERRGDDIIGNGYGQVGAFPGLFLVKTVLATEDPQTHVLVPIRRSADID